jgi:hypothetical protein
MVRDAYLTLGPIFRYGGFLKNVMRNDSGYSRHFHTRGGSKMLEIHKSIVVDKNQPA